VCVCVRFLICEDEDKGLVVKKGVVWHLNSREERIFILRES
jgi:hypothetical protein